MTEVTVSLTVRVRDEGSLKVLLRDLEDAVDVFRCELVSVSVQRPGGHELRVLDGGKGDGS